MSNESRSRNLPLLPLLATYRSCRVPVRDRANVPAFVTVAFLDTATNDQLAVALSAFAERVLPVGFHSSLIAGRVPFLRHALNHLVRGADPLPERLARCMTPGEAYFVAG